MGSLLTKGKTMDIKKITDPTGKNLPIYHVKDSEVIQEFNTLKAAEKFVAYCKELEKQEHCLINIEQL